MPPRSCAGRRPSRPSWSSSTRGGPCSGGPAEYLTGYWTTGAQIADEVSALAAYLQTRLPGPDVTPEQLRAWSRWRGPDVFVLVDDYDP